MFLPVMGFDIPYYWLLKRDFSDLNQTKARGLKTSFRDRKTSLQK